MHDYTQYLLFFILPQPKYYWQREPRPAASNLHYSNITQANLQLSLGDDVDGENKLHFHHHQHDNDNNGQHRPPSPTHTFLGEVIPNPIITITTMISIIISSSSSTPANLKATLRVDDHSVPDEIGLDMHRQGS